MSDIKDFKINNGVFEGYRGPEVEILEIPEGVTKIGDFSLRNSSLKGCKKIIFPASVKVIDDYALNYDFGMCSELKELEFMGEIQSIGTEAFDYVGYYDKGNKGLEKITFHGKVGKIGTYAFHRCKITSLDFPAGIDTIGNSAFCNCKMLKEIHAPGLKKIGNEAFYQCENLEVVDIPENTTIGDEAFYKCDKLKIDGVAVLNGVLLSLDRRKKIPDGVVTIGKRALEGKVEIPMSVRAIHEQNYGVTLALPEGFLLTDEKLSGKGLLEYLKYHRGLTVQESAALYLFQSGKQFDELLAQHLNRSIDALADEMAQLLGAKGKAKHYLRAVEFVMNHAAEIPAETIQKLYDVGVQAKYKKETKLLAQYLPSAESSAEPDATDICAPWRGIFNEHLLDKTIKALKLKNLDSVPLADGSGNAPAYLVKCAIAPYADQFEGKPKHIGNYAHDYIHVQILEDADRAAALLDRPALQELLETIPLFQVPQGMLPYCRYAGSKKIAELISMMRSWESWYTYGATGRSAIIVARGALMLSDAREAMMYMDKCGCLGIYAKIRDTDADSIRDTVLADFGLDANGSKTYHLGEKTILATLAPNLTLSLLDVQADKMVKSLPKKGSDPELLAAASADLSDMKKNLKKVVKGRNDILFQNFLNGQSRNAASWKQSYLTNPVLNMVARLIVWSQGKNSFILTANGPVDCSGQPYGIADGVNIGVAHPIEMSPQKVKAWQQYICKNGIVQPFEQMWEPAREPKSISPDRYSGCKVSVFRFMRSEKHGISFYDEDFHNDIGFSLEQCDLDFERTDWHRHEIGKDETFTLGKFSFRRYSRKVNHIVYLLDKWTIGDRILKDDVSVRDVLDGFTMAQITEFITMATENNCTNVIAVLLDYKNRTFADFDPMEEFSLDL